MAEDSRRPMVGGSGRQFSWVPRVLIRLYGGRFLMMEEVTGEVISVV